MAPTSVAEATYTLNDDYKIPIFGLGTWTLTEENHIYEAVDAALASGYRLFDTAKYYRNEKELGDAFKALLPKYGLTREQIYIETKANISTNTGSVRTSITNMVLDSLEVLQTDYLDLVLIHYPKNWSVSNTYKRNHQDRCDAYGALEELRNKGKIRSIGVSNFEISHIEALRHEGHCVPAVNQCEFHPHLTRKELVAYCKKEGIFFQSHTSLANHHYMLLIDPVVRATMKKFHCTFEQLILAFALKQGIGVIPRSRVPIHIAANALAVHIELDDATIEELNRLNRDFNYSDCDGWNVS